MLGTEEQFEKEPWSVFVSPVSSSWIAPRAIAAISTIDPQAAAGAADSPAIVAAVNLALVRHLERGLG